MANEYVLLDTLKNTLELTSETYADPDITIALSAASRAIDSACERRFYQDPDADQVRYYTPGRSRRLLEVDDLVTFTAFDTDNDGTGAFATSWSLNTDFVLEPLNAAADSEPYTLIRVMPGGLNQLPGGPQTLIAPAMMPRSVRVTGKFGWPAIPDEITQATGILAGRLLRRSREAPFGVIGFALEQGSGAAANLARNDPDVMMLIRPYVRSQIF